MPGPDFVVIDLDRKNGKDGLAAWQKLHPEPVETLTAYTPNNGTHLWFRTPKPLGNTSSKLAPGIDTRGVGGYVVCPPSKIAEGEYRWGGPVDSPLAELPEAVLVALETHKPKSTKGNAAVSEGSRNDTLFRLGCSLKARGLPDAAILADLLTVNKTQCSPPLSTNEVSQIWKSIQRYPKEYSLTEFGNAERFAARFAGEVFFVPEWKKWVVPDNGIWITDKYATRKQRMKSVASDILSEASEAESNKAAKVLRSWHKRSLSASVIRNSLDLATSEPDIAALSDSFDRHPMLLVVENGIVNLETGDLQPHDLSLKLTKRAPVMWDDNAECHRWVEFLNRIFADNQEIIGYIQRLSGYILTGQAQEQVFPIFWGGGKNGKSTLLLVWRGILGRYAMHVQPEIIQDAKRQPNAPSPSVARLRGARLVTTVETEGNHRLAESFIKQITGGDPIEARALYQESFEFIPNFKLVLATNHRPEIRGTDFAIWRRLHLVPFTEVISEKECIPDYHDVLLEEASGVLRWMVEGCLAWQKRERGLDAPEKVKAASKAYREEQDRVGQFLSYAFFYTEAIPRTEVYSKYVEWIKVNGMRPLNASKFYQDLQERGFGKKTVHGCRMITGLPHGNANAPEVADTFDDLSYLY